MTPLQIQMLLHFSYSPEKFEPWGEAQDEAIHDFLQQGLITSENEACTSRLSDKGLAYVDFLCAMPLPVAKWSLPDPWNNSLSSVSQ